MVVELNVPVLLKVDVGGGISPWDSILYMYFSCLSKKKKKKNSDNCTAKLLFGRSINGKVKLPHYWIKSSTVTVSELEQSLDGGQLMNFEVWLKINAQWISIAVLTPPPPPPSPPACALLPEAGSLSFCNNKKQIFLLKIPEGSC